MPDPPYQLDDDDNKEKVKRVEKREEKVKRTYSEDEVQDLVSSKSREAAREAALEVLKERDNQNQNQGNGENEFLGIDPKVVKQLQTTVGVFNALKEFASNPIQKAIESEVGTLSADVVRQAFKRPSAEAGKRDLLDIVLNSQFAYGLGSGLGQRGPELVETMDRTFGKKKTEQFFDSIIGRGGGGGLQGIGNKQISGVGSGAGGADRYRQDSGDVPASGPNPGNEPPGSGSKSRRDAERELILSLDGNNPEHVSAYADSQGGMSVAVAQKMLRIQQDDFIKQLELENVAIQKELDKDVVKPAPYTETAVSFKDIQKKQAKKETQEVELYEDIVEIPDKWKDDDLTQTELESLDKMKDDERIRKLTKKEVPTIVVPPPEIEEKKKDLAIENEVVNENKIVENNIELVAQEDVINQEETKNDENVPEKASDIKLCPKCKKIKHLIETEKGPMCQECKNKRGL